MQKKKQNKKTRSQFHDKVFQFASAGLAFHNLHDLFADFVDLRCLRVRCAAHLIRATFGESNDKNAQQILPKTHNKC